MLFARLSPTALRLTMQAPQTGCNPRGVSPALDFVVPESMRAYLVYPHKHQRGLWAWATRSRPPATVHHFGGGLRALTSEVDVAM
jgi:hypothetical protein